MQSVLELDLTFEATDSFAQPEEVRKALEKTFKTKTRTEWEDLFDGSDACVTPVLEMDEVAQHKHNADRKSFRNFFDNSKLSEPKPAPRLERTPADPEYNRNPVVGENSEEILLELGFANAEINQFLTDGLVLQAKNNKRRADPGSKL